LACRSLHRRKSGRKRRNRGRKHRNRIRRPTSCRPLACRNRPPLPLPQDQLDALLAPIALYPDQLLTQVLMASTYPLEVVEAARFVKANPTLRGQALDDALRDKTWDPSVLSLVPFPQVLDMMNDKLEWTQRLGDAFLADEAGVMRTVQGLRQRAQQAAICSRPSNRGFTYKSGTSSSSRRSRNTYTFPFTTRRSSTGHGGRRRYVPWYWYPPAIWGYPPAPAWWGYRAGYYWGSGWAVHTSYWGWARPNWATNNVNVNINVNNNYWASRPQYRDRYPNGTGTWQHVPEHRKGVAYRDAATYNRYRPTNQQAVQTREGYRGNTTRAPTVQSGGTGAAMMQPGSTGAPTNRATQVRGCATGYGSGESGIRTGQCAPWNGWRHAAGLRRRADAAECGLDRRTRSRRTRSTRSYGAFGTGWIAAAGAGTNVAGADVPDTAASAGADGVESRAGEPAADERCTGPRRRPAGQSTAVRRESRAPAELAAESELAELARSG
jgi:hypothetical protein